MKKKSPTTQSPNDNVQYDLYPVVLIWQQSSGHEHQGLSLNIVLQIDWALGIK